MNQTQRIPYVRQPIENDPLRHTDQRSVVIRKGITKGEKWLWLFAAAVVFLFAVGIVANQTKLYMISRDIEQLDQSYSKSERQNKQLQAEVDTLSSKKRIADIAGELGLKLDPDRIKVIP